MQHLFRNRHLADNCSLRETVACAKQANLGTVVERVLDLAGLVYDAKRWKN